MVNSQKAFVDKMGNEHVIDVSDEMPPDTTAAIFWLKNRQPDKWREKQELAHSGDVPLNVLIQGQKFANENND